jgi:ribose-phosphate pyrophosphokinase
MILVNKQEVNFTKFPNGEGCLDLDFRKHLSLHNRITFKYEGDSSLMELLMFKKAIENDRCQNDLTIVYMPYSRMDRKGGNYLFTLKYISEFINSLKFHKVYIIEPHSDVCLALVDNSEVIDFTQPLFENLLKNENLNMFVLMFPDATAQKRYSKMYSDYDQVYGIKQRDFRTGEISSLKVIGDVSGMNIIIIDDLCSFGGTFIKSAEQLKELGAKDIYLITPHCEDNIYKGNIFKTDLIKKVYSTNSIISDRLNDRIEIADILSVM